MASNLVGRVSPVNVSYSELDTFWFLDLRSSDFYRGRYRYMDSHKI